MKATSALLGFSFLIGSLIAPGSALAQGQSQKHVPDGKGNRPTTLPPPAAAAQGAAGTTGNGINYNGGPVMLGTTNMYYIWYGTWDANSISILTNFANNIGGSPYFNINTTYFDSASNNVSNSVGFGGSTTDNYSRSTNLTDGDIATIVSSALTSGRLPTDNHGVYFVLTSADVNETTGFCTQYCGWHTYGFLNGTNIKYSFIGNSDRCPGSCAAQSPGPNGTTGADGMASVIAHELEESVTDPNLNAWYDSSGEENADKCAWTFGTTYPASNGKAANMKLGALDYLIQRNWVNASGGFCALTYGTTSPDYSLSVSPSSQTAMPGTTTGNYVVTVNPTNGFSTPVQLGVSGMPGGSTANFSVNPTTGASNMTITVGSGAAGGTYSLTITGTANSLSRTVNATLVVPSPNFSLTVSPGSQSVSQGGTTGNYAVTINPTNGFAAPVSFTASNLPSGATATFSPNPATGSSNLKVSVSSSTPTGNKTFTITGTSGSLTHTVNATLSVTALSFTLSVSPNSQTVVQGGTTGNYVTTINWGSGSAGSVDLSASGLPALATVTGLPTSVTASASFTVTAAATLAPGSYPFTIKGIAGSVTKTVAATLVVNPMGSFTLTVSGPLTVGSPGSGNFTVTVTPSGGFNSPVLLSVSGLPTRTNGTFTPTSITGSGTSTLKMTTAKQTSPGTYTITVTGTSGGLTIPHTATLIVQ